MSSDEDWANGLLDLLAELDLFSFQETHAPHDADPIFKDGISPAAKDLEVVNDGLYSLTTLLEEQMEEILEFELEEAATFFIINVQDKFPQIPSTLARKLGNNNWKRQMKIREAEERANTSLLQKIKEETRTHPDTAKDSGIGTSLHTTGELLPIIESQLTMIPLRPTYAESSTSFATRISSKSGITKFPSPPEPLDGTLKTFSCTVCFQSISLATEREWKIHVIRDLQPYR
ncbi:hypothetical protein BJ508DRAFT_53293 [Ascobolus immersus RN42]|uniref:Oxidoreductase acuF-like C2H2 type zinc-finger domain-containing protein n=1 Tax=Ascobolus immersus RN42 TaxID=1160509 RepID=A0A3N4HMH8_ASCIM|nr:hypothetical protein BJ508DRAFT_53293 [Ascobolus immersus RN42]